jgi:group I intron endonuclease
MALIYKLTFMNGKSYIGQTSGTAGRRYQGHAYAAKGGSDLPVHKAWRSLGSPIMEVLHECQDDEVCQMEIDAISRHKTLLPDGYNVLVGGQISPMLDPAIAEKVASKKRGSRHSLESRQKMSASQTGKIHSDKTKRKISDAQKGKSRRPIADASRQKMSDAHKERWANPEFRQRMSAIKIGKKTGPHSDETKAKMSAARKGRISPEGEARRKAAQIAAVKGKPLSEEQKLRLSEIRKLWWAEKRAAAAINQGV